MIKTTNQKQPYQKKHLSQVFLKQDWPCERVAKQFVDQGIKQVIEIGPGGGILTKALLASGLEVLAIEKDERFVSFLKENLPSVRLICEDFLSVDLSSLFETFSDESIGICGNIPYHISSPIFLKVVECARLFSFAQFLVQDEFAKRISAVVDTKDYGSLSIFVQLRCLTHYEFKVPRGIFQPIPKVDSAVVSLKPLEPPYPPELLLKVEPLVRKAFQQRRKKLANSIKELLPQDLSNCPIDLSRRCETLTSEEFLSLSQFLFHSN